MSFENVMGEQVEAAADPGLQCAATNQAKRDLKIVPAKQSASSFDDPLLRRVEMPLTAQYYPLGFRVDVITNSEQVLAAARESWSCFPAKLSLQSPLQLRLQFGVAEDSSWQCPPAPLVRAQEHLLSMMADQENFATCDLAQGFAFGWLSKGVERRRSYLRYHFLEAAALVLLAALRVTPLHAACVELAGCGMLLFGDSGAGKSTLAYACARAGWTYTTDDASYLVNGRDDRLVVGNSHQIRFRPSAAQLFPELQGLSVTPRAAGKPSIEFPTGRHSYLKTADECRIDRIVFLNREDHTPPGLHPYPRELARQWFSESLSNTCGNAEAQGARLAKLLTVPVHELRYRDLDWAVRRLEDLALEGK